MSGAGILAGDIAIINSARAPIHGCVVLALVESEFTVKRYRFKDGRIVLQAENPAYPDIEIRDGSEFEVWGVVSSIVRTL